jgi:hypothetical protein
LSAGHLPDERLIRQIQGIERCADKRLLIHVRK